MRIATAVGSYHREAEPAQAIYLDSAATSRMDGRVLQAVSAVMADQFLGNPNATHHSYGAKSHQLVEQARSQISALLDCAPQEIIYTSGATEANNLALLGIATHLRSIGKTHIITSAVEHKCVLAPLQTLATAGFTVTVLPVKSCGMIEARAIEKAITTSTGLVSVQAVNNETGTIQPLAEIAKILAGRNILFHTDAAQAPGKTPFSVVKSGVDFASLSAHKMHGPQGIGALYARNESKNLLEPLSHGGGQEGNLRAGTLPTALCVGFGLACEILEDNQRYLQGLRRSFLRQIAHLEPIVHGHSDPAWNVPGILNLRFAGIESETLIMALPMLAIGTGAACTQTGTTTSHVIKAITNSDVAAREALRLSFDRMTTQMEINEAASQIIAAVTTIRKLQEADTQ